MTETARSLAGDLCNGDVHVWTISVGDASDGGRLRARDRMRNVLGLYLNCRPDDVPIERAGNGKPNLDRGKADGLSFSLSHSNARTVLALAAGRRIGVDLERVRPTRDVRAIASRFFVPAEAKAIDSAHGEAAARFFRTWVRKEAYLKGLGGSVPAGLRRFRISVRVGEPVAILDTELERGPSVFSLHDIEVPEGYAGALAVEGACTRIRQMRL